MFVGYVISLNVVVKKKPVPQYVLYPCWPPDIIINLKTEFHNLLQMF